MVPTWAWEALVRGLGDPRSPAALGTRWCLSTGRGNQLKETLDLFYSPTSPYFLYLVTLLSFLCFVVVVFQETDDFVFILSEYSMYLCDSQG